jgi:hypothetical protein
MSEPASVSRVRLICEVCEREWWWDGLYNAKTQSLRGFAQNAGSGSRNSSKNLSIPSATNSSAVALSNGSLMLTTRHAVNFPYSRRELEALFRHTRPQDICRHAGGSAILDMLSMCWGTRRTF